MTLAIPSIFETWIKQCLIKELKPGQTVILDNVSFHKSKRTQELIESASCKIIFLPPYSPDLNPIEKFCANMKKWIKNKIHLFDNLYRAIEVFFALSNSS
ncbi:IS630 family transposase domain protein [Rickettsiales endosymbiont of Paramecium tredecaurelia]|uniref:transposase n=1 Tax=Candidatus Sarmatiella mevalonica TaxID=2770581 RepID=UPI0019209FDA|nr:transposase [Candidatus Sarmatiella mevalonica]MBL3284542.1 IS630 family transposase domain protein [Candidatus Sarmatiella mevalonica]